MLEELCTIAYLLPLAIGEGETGSGLEFCIKEWHLKRFGYAWIMIILTIQRLLYFRHGHTDGSLNSTPSLFQKVS